ncbi:hypothetical protein EHQ81_01060 [Leptospira selangorensis]|uniref:Uncharacterized protein n=1 Tax=Leptospira selangorensis TaxID=2484982 RepID=A0A5F2BZK4_9LEPT|nr:hypothetical protein [Leptospira selangorensis]TGM12500.1 hypothetical protein EHQ82_19945 [Leptospira selangorensis]TGM16728.1 hypothetical protein EHQ81_01060 [Leptospira selangorensis]
MKNFIKVLYILGAIFLILFLFIFSVWKWRILPDSLGRTYSTFAAKEGCSCLFVSKGSEKYCKDYTKQFFSPDLWIQDDNSLSIEFYTLFTNFKSKAIFKPKQGCSLYFP